LLGEERLVLTIDAKPEELGGIRDAVARRGADFGLDDESLMDLKTVVSEACGNAILHAYPAESEHRPLEIELERDSAGVIVRIRDQGGGLRPAIGRSKPGAQLGLLLIGAMSSCMQLRSVRGRGTELAARLPFDFEPTVGRDALDPVG
jgi:serine/threonine-protein kinase RsbW